MTERDVVFRVKRYRPESGGKPTYQEYRIPYRDDMVVLDGLNYIKDQVDPTLTYRWSCRMGICGSCGANVNGQPRLTCGTYIRDVHRGAVTIDPLANFPILKDLVVDFDDFLEKLASVTPYIVREESTDLTKEFVQYPEDVEAYRQQSLCINCMLCYAACPVFGASPEFVGPAAAARGMVAPQPAVPGLPTARVRRRGFRGLRTHFPEPAPNAPRRRIGVHGVRRNDADAADLVRQPCVVRPPGLARGHLVHADRQGPADSVHRAAPPVESRVRRQRAAVDRRLRSRRLSDLRGLLSGRGNRLHARIPRL